MRINIDKSVREACTKLRLGIVVAQVQIKPAPKKLLEEISLLIDQKKSWPLEEIKNLPEISDARIAYKNLGKEPSRYRLSAEALHRRVIRGLGLYEINNVVDLINFISLKSGFSIGGYNLEKIQGAISLRKGWASDKYQAIGRGAFNVENLPVLCDSVGAFGNASSDSERTKIDNNCRQIMFVYFDFGSSKNLAKNMDLAVQSLQEYGNATDIKTSIIS